MDIRSKVADLANQYIGCGANKDKSKYIDLLANDKDSAAMRNDMLKMSSCALTVRGLWRKSGCDHKLLTSPYRIGKAMSDILEIGKHYNAWYTPKDNHEVGLGDAVIVGSPGKEHVYTITELLGGLEFISVDGGQGQGGTSINQCSRKWSLDNGVMRDHCTSIRPVIGFVDISKLGMRED